MDEVYAEAERRGIEIIAVPTSEARELLMRELANQLPPRSST